MDNEKWNSLVRSVRGESNDLRVALIVDSPWIPEFAGISHMEYYLEFDKWLKSNLDLYGRFPDIFFLPGFWVEYGMAAEASGFGSRVRWSKDSLPTPHPIIDDIGRVKDLVTPRPSKDGLMPFVIHNYRRVERAIRDEGSEVKMVAARGPLAVASWIRGVTSLVKDVKKNPEEARRLFEITTELIIDWLKEQEQVLSQVEGVLLLDDIVGFLSPEDFSKFAKPYLEKIFTSFPNHLRFFHNDTANLDILPQLADLDFEVFNFSHEMDIAEVRAKVGQDLCLMGNLAPLDVLARGTPDQVREETSEIISKVQGDRKLLLSAGGGVAPGTPVENIAALSRTVEEYNRS